MIEMSNQTATEKEMTAMAEEELSRLQRQLRIMEEDRMAYSDETKAKLEKQRKIIKGLKEEKKKILEDLRVATSTSHTKEDLQHTINMEKLLKKYKKYCKEADDMKSEIKEIDVQQKKMETEIKKLRRDNGVTEQEYQYRIKSGNNTIKALENRLEHSVKKFCKIIVDNKDLREEIDHLLVERCQFNETWDQLLLDLKNGKKLMMELVDQATSAYDQREECSSKLEALKKRAQHDLVVHAEEMREIKRILDHDNRLQEFLCIKGQRRVLKDLEAKERLKKEEEQRTQENQLKTYVETLTEIRNYCSEDDVDRMAAQFIKQEEENFALFNYVNELNHEIEDLQIKVKTFEEKIEEQQKLSDEKVKSRNATLDNMQKELDEKKTEADEAKEELKKSEEKLKQILDGILDVFKLLRCERGPILELLKGEQINLHNVMIYMGTIEKKMSDIINSLYQMSRPTGKQKKLEV